LVEEKIDTKKRNKQMNVKKQKVVSTVEKDGTPKEDL
jgi:hypothetical protein